MNIQAVKYYFLKGELFENGDVWKKLNLTTFIYTAVCLHVIFNHLTTLMIWLGINILEIFFKFLWSNITGYIKRKSLYWARTKIFIFMKFHYDIIPSFFLTLQIILQLIWVYSWLWRPHATCHSNPITTHYISTWHITSIFIMSLIKSW